MYAGKGLKYVTNSTYVTCKQIINIKEIDKLLNLIHKLYDDYVKHKRYCGIQNRVQISTFTNVCAVREDM